MQVYKGVLSPKSVEKHVENVDFPPPEPLYIQFHYAYFRQSEDLPALNFTKIRKSLVRRWKTCYNYKG